MKVQSSFEVGVEGPVEDPEGHPLLSGDAELWQWEPYTASLHVPETPMDLQMLSHINK